jgi:hypothetical protein
MRSHRRRLLHLAPALALLVLAACTPGGGTPSPTPGPTIIPGPSGGTGLSAAELRLHLIEQLGPRWYCDPDEYPVAQGTEQERAIERFPEMVAENELYRAIAARLSIDPEGQLTDAEKLAIYRQWKVAVSIELTVIGEGRYRFDYLAQPVPGGTEGLRTAGIIDDTGTITVEERAPAGEPVCPICLVRGTLIETPNGPVPVEQLRIGDPIWTVGVDGRRIAGTVVALGSTQAPATHRVVRLTLDDGRTVTASGGHPLADGRRLDALQIGDPVDGALIASLEWLAYGDGRTFDLVASGPTGSYFAGGIPLGSTIR